ncbi:MAG TPA: class I SAM-dependent methyltransferase [Vicinamibacteria bacterium]|nr:class I SAM-dependent methyltransferase [Vicinamibacteria bacterium]
MRPDEYTNMFALEDRFWWYRGIHDLILGYLLKRPAPRLSILDAGCGTGKLMTLLAPLGDVSGIDASEQALQYCRERGLSSVEIVDLNSWSPTTTYDVITCIDVLCHESVRDMGPVLDRFRDGLRPNGVLILNLPAFESLRREHDTVVQTVRRLRQEDLLPLLRARGFEIVLSTYRLPALYFMIRMRKALVGAGGADAPQSDLKLISPLLDRLLWWMNWFENRVILAGLRFPVGSSLFVVARKPS